MDLSQPVQVASVQTLARRLHRIPTDYFQLLVIDEAHHSNAGTWAKVLEHCSSARVLGVTATPIRSDGRGLNEWYQAMVLGPTPAELTAEGFLASARVLAPPGPSMVGLRKRMGDFDMTQAGQMLQAGQAMGDCLTHYRRYLDGQTAIAFCCSIAHAEAVAELFQRNGVAAASIDGTMDSSTRERLLADLGAGRLKVLTSCQLIGEGVDVPSVAGCILLRPTQSVSLHLQMIGRCLRPQPGKTAVILDHVGNTQRLGHHLEEREWSLDGTPKRDREAAPSVKVCPKCFACLPSGVQRCSECGHEFEIERRELVHIEGELQELRGIFRKGQKVEAWDAARNEWEIGYSYTFIRYKDNSVETGEPLVEIRDGLQNYIINQRFVRPTSGSLKRQQGDARTLEDLIQIGKRRNMKNPAGWARHVMAARSLRSGKARVRELVS
jgi:superfamily II DNA or RNA helicase